MPEKKRKHYVSQFLLRYFSCSDGEHLINFYNRKTDKLFRKATIKTQAQSNYFYGEDLTFENYLGVTEKLAAPVIREILETGELPPKKDIRYKRLLHFIGLYAFRTKAEADHMEDHLNHMMKEFAKYDDRLAQIDWENLRLAHPEPGAFNLGYHLKNWVFCADLEPCLVVNITNKDFFTSDNPMIQYNPFMQKRKCYWNANSLINKGLIILFPLSPQCYLMMYDPFVYDVRYFKDKVVIDKADDVYKINLLQSLSSEQFIYFPDTHADRYIKNMAIDGLKNRTDKHVHKKIPHPETGNPALFSYYLKHKIDFYFSFIRDGTEASAYDVFKQMSHPRNQELVDWVANQKMEWEEAPQDE